MLAFLFHELTSSRVHSDSQRIEEISTVLVSSC